MKFLALIPARYASTRFPGKPLADIAGKPMIRHVYERVRECFTDCYVATDDLRIEAAVAGFGGRVILTSTDHKSGTDRCREALDIAEDESGKKYDAVVNIQGDEPFVSTEQLQLIQGCFAETGTQIATLIKAFGPDEDIFNPNCPKVVKSADGYALYFSRSVIPYQRAHNPSEWAGQHMYWKHIGLYAYRTEVLRQITALQQSPLELAESLEQLRWLENGFRIRLAVTRSESLAVDTPEDLQRLLEHHRF